MNNNQIHHEFRLNGISFSKEVLKETAYGFIKDGAPYQKAIGTFLCDWLDDSPTLQVHTSGSTGTPKQIVLEKQHMVNSALATGQFFDLQSGNLALLCLSADYIAGKMMLVRAMVLGLHLDSVEPISNPLKESDKQYDFGAMVPLQLQNSIQQIEQVKTLLVGGAPLSRSAKQQLKTAPSRIYETYGMTETITHVAVKEIATAHNVVKQSKTFMALPNVSFSTDTRNCLVIAAPKVSEKQIVTNDMIRLVSETEFEWLGRYDNVINSGGVKLFPEQIEEKLTTVMDQRFFVAGVPDEKLGQKLILIFEGETDVSVLRQKIATLSSLGKFEIPKEIYTLPRFLETKTGKIRRQQNINLTMR